MISSNSTPIKIYMQLLLYTGCATSTLFVPPVCVLFIFVLGSKFVLWLNFPIFFNYYWNSLTNNELCRFLSKLF